MNAIKLLTDQHRKMEALFKELESAAKNQDDRYRELLAEASFLLLDHMEAEEKVFYPALSKHDSEVLEGIEEHNVMKPLIQTLALLPQEDETVSPKIEVLGELNEHHMREEEKDLFPKFRKHFSEEELVELGTQLETFMSTLAESR